MKVLICQVLDSFVTNGIIFGCAKLCSHRHKIMTFAFENICDYSSHEEIENYDYICVVYDSNTVVKYFD